MYIIYIYNFLGKRKKEEEEEEEEEKQRNRSFYLDF